MQGGYDFDFVVVGSGFGGSVVALRLAEAGKSVLVLERGQPYPPGSFPRSPFGMRTNFWAPDADPRLYGLFDVWGFQSLAVILASGLGGGSLIYANVMLRKEERTFVREDLRDGGYEHWPVTRAELEHHYDNVEKIQRPQRFPLGANGTYATPKTRAMIDAGERMDVPCELPPLAVTFAPNGGPPAPGMPIQEVVENLHGVPRSTCRLCGECDLGCNYGAKNTLDLTYLSLAVKQRAKLRTCCEVDRIEPIGDRPGYVVGYRQLVEARGDHPKKLLDPSESPVGSVTARQVVLSAGTIGTTRLLLENRASLPRLSRALGTRLSANGDYMAWVRKTRNAHNGEWRYLEPSRGPVITASLHVDEDHAKSGRGYYMQDAGAPVFADWTWQQLELAGDLWRLRKKLTRRMVDLLRGRRDTHESDLLAGMLGDAHSSAAMMPVLAMGRDVPNGRMSIKGDRLELDWSTKPSKAYYADLRRSLKSLAGELDGKLLRNGLELRHRAVTVHAVGGCPMSVDAAGGVVDPWGEVHGYPGLWVADGSVMPGPVGPNPSFTIAALADRFSDVMLGARRRDPNPARDARRR